MEELFNFKGKITRLEYFQISIFCYLLFYAFLLTISSIFKPSSENATLGLLILTLVLIGCIVAIKIAAVIKRINDIGISLLYFFIILIPGINIIFSIYLLFAQGKDIKTQQIQQPEDKEDVKSCSYCCAKIPYQAKKCMFCGEWVDFESIEDEAKPHSYWTINIILAVIIVGLCIYSANAPTTNIFSKENFQVRNLEYHYKEAQKFCKRFDFQSESQQYNCISTYIEDNTSSKVKKEFSRIIQNCRNTNFEEAEFIVCITKAINNSN